MSDLGDGVKPEYEYKGIIYKCLNLEQYTILEHKMQSDIMDQAAEAIKFYALDESQHSTFIREAWIFRNQISITSIEGLKLLDTITYQRDIVVLSLEQSSKGQLTREQCRAQVDNYQLPDVMDIARNLLIRDSIFSNIDDPEWYKNTHTAIKDSMEQALEELEEFRNDIETGAIAKKKDSEETEKVKKNPKEKAGSAKKN